ncbi:ABC transporter ATP-binding protein [Noviherbaspirillum massiliense]|uniref:ABC transporter ATP-binding protein n=1 Tax=Noviherbaspirillum massiliense TaxID=1465823 RepID=UPI0002F13EEE|nr:ABC transporter ATP-binding protein [Noviherbaspirillum massiliense]
MRLALHDISKKHGAEDHLYPMSLELMPGAINVLLGPTQAGKTSLMRIMAGLDRPSTGRVLADGQDVTGVPVRERKLAMVYQQFINYPSMTVFDNIASPLRIQGIPEAQVRIRVAAMAERLHIAPFLQRLPAELSGGQQQRTALARALIKDASLLLLDEPLVNLDYKLREELREELAELFAEGRTTVVYATTEPLEALQLGGYTAVLSEGRLLQYGRTLDVFHAPGSIEAARVFSDPPINLIPASLETNGLAHAGAGLALPLTADQRARASGHRSLTLGLRAHSLRSERMHADDFPIEVEVALSEISGSETYVHMHRDSLSLVAQLTGVHDIALGERCTMYCRPEEIFLYTAEGALLFAPHQPAAGA